MAHDRKLVISSVSLIEGLISEHASEVLAEIRDELEALMISTNYLDGAPFEWISQIIRFGKTNESAPRYSQINDVYGDLPLAIEIDSHALVNVGRRDVYDVYTRATLKSLIHAGEKHNLSIAGLCERLANLERETSAV